MPFTDYGGFGESYFEGNSVTSPEPSGYSDYRRELLPFDWYAEKMKNELQAQNIDPTGATVLVVGCAYGFTVDYLRTDWAIDAVGVDVSQWAVDNAVVDGISQGDVTVRNDLKNAVQGKADVIFNECVFECLTDSEAQTAVDNMRSEAKETVVHRTWTDGWVNPDYYNTKTLAEWQSLCDPDGNDRWFTEREFQPTGGL